MLTLTLVIVWFLSLLRRESGTWGKIRKRTDPLCLLHLSPHRHLCEGDVVENAREPAPGTGAVSRFRLPLTA